MDIEFDPAKDRTNLAKHGVSLNLAVSILESPLAEKFEWVAGEERGVALGRAALRLYVCVYTMRGATHRIISVRRATRWEIARWE